ncbi:MAG TPA: thioredoxin domain-containing protein [Candidatus Limnocylindrales bacterium]
MSTNSSSTGARPPKTPGSQRPPATRQERRDAARRGQRLASARTVAVKRPAWQSPMALITAAAVVVGLVVVVLASGVLSPKATVGTLVKPLRPAPVALIDPANPRALGQANAPVKVEVWSDFQCPACDAFATTVEPDLIDKYVATGKVQLIYRDFAFIDKGAADGESQQSGAAARCAGDKFWPFHDYLFENQNPKGENLGTFSAAFLASVADAVNADRTAYDACMANGAADMVAAVKAETAQGTSAGINQTPTIALNGKLQKGGALPMTTLGPAIDALIAAGSPAPAASASPAASTAP